MVLLNGFAFELIMLCLFAPQPTVEPGDEGEGDDEATVVINPVALVFAAAVAAAICIPMNLIFAWSFDPIIYVNVTRNLLRMVVFSPYWAATWLISRIRTERKAAVADSTMTVANSTDLVTHSDSDRCIVNIQPDASKTPEADPATKEAASASVCTCPSGPCMGLRDIAEKHESVASEGSGVLGRPLFGRSLSSCASVRDDTKTECKSSGGAILFSERHGRNDFAMLGAANLVLRCARPASAPRLASDCIIATSSTRPATSRPASANHTSISRAVACHTGVGSMPVSRCRLATANKGAEVEGAAAAASQAIVAELKAHANSPAVPTSVASLPPVLEPAQTTSAAVAQTGVSKAAPEEAALPAVAETEPSCLGATMKDSGGFQMVDAPELSDDAINAVRATKGNGATHMEIGDEAASTAAALASGTFIVAALAPLARKSTPAPSASAPGASVMAEKRSEAAAEEDAARAAQEAATKLMEEQETNLRQTFTAIKDPQQFESIQQALKILTANPLCKANGAQKNVIAEASSLLKKMQNMHLLKTAIAKLNQKVIAEIRSFSQPKPEIVDCMRCCFLLLGTEEELCKEWKQLQGLIGKMGKLGLKRRINQFTIADGRELAQQVVQEARSLNDKVDVARVLDVSRGAATFFAWCKGVLDEL